MTGTADLTTCDLEPIHIPGSVQPHGMLFALSPHSLFIDRSRQTCARSSVATRRRCSVSTSGR